MGEKYECSYMHTCMFNQSKPDKLFVNRILIHCQGNYPIISLLAATFFSKGHFNECLVIANTKGWYDRGGVGKKAGQDSVVWLSSQGRRSAAPLSCPIPLQAKVSHLVTPAEILREKRTANNISNYLKRLDRLRLTPMEHTRTQNNY